ncbi:MULTISPECIES: hypothetical protein [Streptomyces]|uniref:hypothetical protein n=1 Tax=Streptomyces TaxID=1883 RepID=UPI002E16FDB4|nr:MULTISPECIES: hypothetical protein [unclassified Streptomyces]
MTDHAPWSEAELRALAEESMVDAWGEGEQRGAFCVAIADHLAVPFTTHVLGVVVRVEAVEENLGGIVALCRRGSHRQAVGILDLPLPDPPPEGAEYIEAYRLYG